MRKTSGVSLMLLIFLSLCLITFSLLSLSGATADETLSQKAAQRTTQYYAAVSSANEILSHIDTALAVYLEEAVHADDPETAYKSSCANITETVPSASWDAQELLITFSVPITDGQIIRIALQPEYPTRDDDTLFQITAFQTVNTGEWVPDKSENLFQPGHFDLEDAARVFP